MWEREREKAESQVRGEDEEFNSRWHYEIKMIHRAGGDVATHLKINVVEHVERGMFIYVYNQFPEWAISEGRDSPKRIRNWRRAIPYQAG